MTQAINRIFYKHAFEKGVLDGLCAPFDMFSNNDLARRLEAMQQNSQAKVNVGGLANDWARVGQDLEKAMNIVKSGQ